MNARTSAATPAAVHSIGYARPHASAVMSLPARWATCLASGTGRGVCDGQRERSRVPNISIVGLREGLWPA